MREYNFSKTVEVELSHKNHKKWLNWLIELQAFEIQIDVCNENIQ